MARRPRMIHPDEVLETQTYGPIPVVSDAAWIEAIVQLAQTQALCGGVITAVVDRHPTDLPGEMVTTRGFLEWKDRTDARPQPEPQTGASYTQQTGTDYAQQPADEPIPGQLDIAEMDEASGSEEGEQEVRAAPEDDIQPVEGEDITSAPELARS